MNSLITTPRPLSKLTPMIRKELKAGFQAGERHWKKVGRLLNEARNHFPKAGPNKKGLTFHRWVEKNFQHPWTGESISRHQAKRWMSASKNSSARDRTKLSLNSQTDNRSPNHDDYNPKLDWQSGVRKVQQKINTNQLAKQWEDEKREGKERAKLARQIVEAGYRALAAVVHPDKRGGSKEAMAKLTDAKKWLDEQIRSNS